MPACPYLGDRRGGLAEAAARRMKVRDRECYAYLLLHLDCPTLKAMIRAEADKKGGRAWDVMLRECAHKTSALAGTKRRAKVATLTIRGAVGHSASSITDYNRLLTDKNEELPMEKKFSADEIVEKILTDITHPAILANAACSLLEIPVAERPTRFYTQTVEADEHTDEVPGGWIRSAVIGHIDELWREAWDRGEINPAVATDRSVRTGPSPRADGMLAGEEAFNFALAAHDEPVVTDEARVAVERLRHHQGTRRDGTHQALRALGLLRP